MDIERQLHTAIEIASFPADVETQDTYEDRIGHYEAQNFTFIPMPKSSQYYNTEKGWVKDIEEEQILQEDTHLMEVLRKMQRYPFLIIDMLRQDNYYIIDIGGEKKRIQDKMFQTLIENPDDEIVFSPNGQEITAEEMREMVSEDQPLSVHELREQFPELTEDLAYEYDEQYGIITLVDLNKRGMKQMLYKVISELSANLGAKIETKYESEDILKHLRPSTIGRWKKDKINGLDMHISEQMNLLEMMQVIQSSDSQFVDDCGFESKNDVETLNEINEVRNRVMHANRSLIYDRKEITEVINVINESQRIISNSSA